MAKKSLWILFAILAISIGLYPGIYFLIDRNFGLLSSKDPALLSNILWNAGFYAHILPGGLALLIGWIQFSKTFRQARLKWHRSIGKLYVISALTSALAAVYISFYSTGGTITFFGFFSLGCIWFGSTLMAYLSARKGDLASHEEYMIFSYAACFSAVTLRIWLPLLIMGYNDFIPAYKVVAWLCWVPNIMVAYLIIRGIQKHKRTALS